jgi:hypothetical protein
MGAHLNYVFAEKQPLFSRVFGWAGNLSLHELDLLVRLAPGLI